jgi:hypothetical protein
MVDRFPLRRRIPATSFSTVALPLLKRQPVRGAENSRNLHRLSAHAKSQSPPGSEIEDDYKKSYLILPRAFLSH